MQRKDHHDWASNTYVDEWVKRQQQHVGRVRVHQKVECQRTLALLG